MDDQDSFEAGASDATRSEPAVRRAEHPLDRSGEGGVPVSCAAFQPAVHQAWGLRQLCSQRYISGASAVHQRCIKVRIGIGKRQSIEITRAPDTPALSGELALENYLFSLPFSSSFSSDRFSLGVLYTHHGFFQAERVPTSSAHYLFCFACRWMLLGTHTCLASSFGRLVEQKAIL